MLCLLVVVIWIVSWSYSFTNTQEIRRFLRKHDDGVIRQGSALIDCDINPLVKFIAGQFDIFKELSFISKDCRLLDKKRNYTLQRCQIPARKFYFYSETIIHVDAC